MTRPTAPPILPGEETAIFAQADELNAHIARFLEHYG